MARDGTGNYALPPGTDGVPDHTIESALYNSVIHDIETTFNQVLPVAFGGTGASNPVAAMDAEHLNGVSRSGDTMTGNLEIDSAYPTLILNKKLSGQEASIIGELAGNKRWTIMLGDSGAESTDGSGSNFSIVRHDNAGALLDVPILIDRLTGMVRMTSTTVPPPPTTVAGDISQLAVNKPVATQTAAILGQSAGIARWRINMGDVATESSPQTGSNFRIERYTNTGVFIDFPLYIERSSGAITMSGAPVAPAAILSLNATSTTAASIAGRKNGIIHWGLSLGDGTTASDLRVNRFNDAGALVDVPFVVTRTNGKITMNGAPPDQQGILHINKVSGAGTQAAAIQGQTALSTRWQLALGDGQPEGGGNTGSDFKVHRHADNGVFIDPVFQIQRNTGFAVFWKDTVYKPSGGFFTAPSDARIKTVIGDYDSGLQEIKALQPRLYKYNGTDVSQPGSTKVAKGKPNPDSIHYTAAVSGKEYAGLIAQEAETVMPELVTKIPAVLDGVPVDDYRIMDSTALVYALVNACKELAARVEALEAAR